MLKTSIRLRQGASAVAAAITILLSLPVQANDDLALLLDFANENDLSVYDWFHQRDFELKKDADERDKIDFFRADGALHIVARQPAFGMAVRQVDLPSVRRLRLHWGVSDYPEGVSYQHGIDNEAVMVYVFFWP